MYEMIKRHMFVVCGLGMILTLCATLIEYFFFGTTNVTDLLLHSPIFNITLIVFLWFIAPVFVKLTNIDIEQNVKPHTFLILGSGLLFILITILILWLMS